MELKKKENIGWIDLLRVLACFFVVFSHSCDAFIGQFDANRESFLTGVFLGSLMRPCVPIFVMMTGVLLLPVQTDMAAFYKKRIGRLIPPMIFWSLVLPVLYFIYLNYINPDTQNPLISMPDHSLEALWFKLYTFIFNFNFDTVPLWYLYMLIGLYLIMPIISGWLEKVSKKELKLFLGIWGISLIAPYVKMFAPALGYQGNYGNMGLWGVCDWNDYGSFYYFSGFIGYLLLAYYLTKYPLKWSWKKLLSITINVSDRIPDHILWVRHHTKLLPGKLCLSGNCMVLCRYQRIYDDLPGFCNRTEDKSTFKPQIITHGITRIRHLSEPLCICIHCLRFTGYRVAAVYCTNYLYGLYCIPDMLRHRLANVKKQIDQSLHPVT